MEQGSMLGLGLAVNGTSTNLLLYLLKEYNVESIDAAQIANIVRGSLNLVPVAGAIISDSYFGCFPVILAGTAINVLVSAHTLTTYLHNLQVAGATTHFSELYSMCNSLVTVAIVMPPFFLRKSYSNALNFNLLGGLMDLSCF